MRTQLRAAALAALACARRGFRPGARPGGAAPTPKAVIYPGDIIRDEMLTDIPGGGARDGGGPFVEDRSFVVGKMARLTLLPGHAIPFAGVVQPQARRQRRRGEACLRRRRPPHCDDRRGAAGRGDRRRRAGSEQRQRRHGFRRRAAGRLGQGRRRMRRLLLAALGAVAGRRARRAARIKDIAVAAQSAGQPACRLWPGRRPERHRRHVPQRAVHAAGGAGHAAEPRHGHARRHAHNRNVAAVIVTADLPAGVGAVPGRRHRLRARRRALADGRNVAPDPDARLRRRALRDGAGRCVGHRISSRRARGRRCLRVSRPQAAYPTARSSSTRSPARRTSCGRCSN